MNTKRRIVISYKNCSQEILNEIKAQYPGGYNDHVIKVTKSNQEFFYAITLDTPDTTYLIKVDVKIDNLTEEEFEKEFGDNDPVSDDTSFGSDTEEDAIDPIDTGDAGFEE